MDCRRREAVNKKKSFHKLRKLAGQRLRLLKVLQEARCVIVKLDKVEFTLSYDCIVPVPFEKTPRKQDAVPPLSANSDLDRADSIKTSIRATKIVDSARLPAMTRDKPIAGRTRSCTQRANPWHKRLQPTQLGHLVLKLLPY